MIKRIRLDLDDVLNNLSLELLKFDGLHYTSYDEIDWEWGYDIIAAVASLKGEEPMGLKEYWSRFPREIWSDTLLSSEFREILDFCESKVGLENTLIVTSPTKCPESSAGKVEWMVKYLPEQMHRRWVITPRKWELGFDKEALLIDDSEGNCAMFNNNGGQSIIVPRPWNLKAGHSVMDSIKKQWATAVYRSFYEN